MTDAEHEVKNLPVPVQHLSGLPAPRDLGKLLREALEGHIEEARKGRDVQLPEDTYPLIRSLAVAGELLDDYATTFKSVAKVSVQEIEEELREAVGDQDGVPNSGMTVPDAQGDVKLSLTMTNGYDIDVNTLRSVVVALVAELEGAAEAADLAIQTLLECGNFTPQVSKVRELADQVSRQGDDQMASVVKSAIRKTVTYKGVKVSRA